MPAQLLPYPGHTRSRYSTYLSASPTCLPVLIEDLLSGNYFVPVVRFQSHLQAGIRQESIGARSLFLETRKIGVGILNTQGERERRRGRESLKLREPERNETERNGDRHAQTPRDRQPSWRRMRSSPPRSCRPTSPSSAPTAGGLWTRAPTGCMLTSCEYSYENGTCLYIHDFLPSSQTQDCRGAFSAC